MIEDFFRSLGYTVSYDYSRRTGAVWWEIYEGNHLIIQIDKHAPFETLLKDLVHMLKDEPWEQTPVDYTVSGPDSPQLTVLLNKVDAFVRQRDHAVGSSCPTSPEAVG